MTTALIADDEPHLAAYLRTQLLALWPELVLLPIARNGVEAAEAIAAQRPELAFLDIKMPGLTGLEVAQGIEGATKVVFVTAYDEYAVRAFEQEVLDYVLKPVKTERLRQTVERLQRALAAPTPGDDARLAAALKRLLPVAAPAEHLRWIRASSGEVTHQIDIEEVLFFHADEKYTCVQTAAAEHLIRTPIHELVAQLETRRFFDMGSDDWGDRPLSTLTSSSRKRRSRCLESPPVE